jgi:hypothetical protein
MIVLQSPQLMRFEREEGSFEARKKRRTKDENPYDNQEYGEDTVRHPVLGERWSARSSSEDV